MVAEVYVPPINYDEERLRSANIFRDTFGHMTDGQWLATLRASVSDQTIQGVVFPGFPDPDLQSRVHGSSGVDAIHEAFMFYLFVKGNLQGSLRLDPDARLLDFGCGWGRMMRPYMRHYDLANIYGFEPSTLFSKIARGLNPYACILTGEFLPNRRIPRDSFDLVIGYSVFSHLSPHSAALWLRETAEVLRPGGFAAFTTWGGRFLRELANQKARGEAGEEVHWFYTFVLSKIGDTADALRRYEAGEFIWHDTGLGPLYGEAYFGPEPLKKIIEDNLLPLELVLFDTNSLPQDTFILRRT